MITSYPSPNYDARPLGGTVDILLLHYTGMPSAEAALERLCDPAAKVSAHYLIKENGRVYQLVAEDRRAWHAGAACWAGETDINSCSIGIELVNPGHEFGYRPFPEPQMAALVPLARDILARHRIARHRVLGHSDVAPSRKEDPGELFDWQGLAAQGIGLWPETGLGPETPLPLAELQAILAAYGYCIKITGTLDDQTRAVLRAFQRHFRPTAITGEPDAETVALLAGVVLA